MKLETYGRLNLFKRIFKHIKGLFKNKKGWLIITPKINLKKYDLNEEE